MARLRISSALFLFALGIVFLQTILLNGYALNLLGLPASAETIFFLTALELIFLILALVRTPIQIENDSLELAGFLFVVAGTFLYFVLPALPTLFAPSYSGDPALHLSFIYRVYSTGHIIGDDPGGPSLIAATIAHWLAIDPVRVMHPVAALWLALTAGAVYGIAGAVLPARAESKAIALGAAWALFIQGGIFSQLILGPNYFFSQAAGQLFLVATVWFLAEYRRVDHPLWLALAGGAFFTIGVLYQLWLFMPATLLAWILFLDFRRGGAARTRALTLVSVVGVAFLLLLFAIILIQPQFIPALARFQLEAAVGAPGIAGFGDWFLILPVIGIFIAARDPSRFSFPLTFLGAVALQTGALWLSYLVSFSARYWLVKSLFLWAFPLAVLSVIPFFAALEFARAKKIRARLSVAASFIAVSALGVIAIITFQPPPSFQSLSETDIQVALWAKQNLDTSQINYLGPKSITAQMIGVGIWGEQYPGDLFFDFARLGPRTFEEWRADSSWGDYLFIASGQYVPPDASVQTLYRAGASAVVAKPRAASEKNRAALGMFGDTFRFLNYQIPLSAFHPGETLSVVAQIEPRRVPPRSVVWRLQLRDREHNAGAEARLAPFENKFPMQRWSPGKILTDTLVLPLSPELRPGLYDLQLGLYRVQTGDALPFVSADEKQDDVFQLGQVKIIQPEIPDHYLGALEPIDARVGDFATLRGARVQKQSPLVPGAEIRVELFWRAEQRVSTDYTIFAQLLDARGNLIAQRDSAPRAGTYPTLIWDAGETIADAYALTIPRDAAPGAYQIIVGMYHWQTLQRLPITDQTGRALGDHIVLPFELQIRPYSQ